MENSIEYREYRPPARLLPYLECFWTMRAAAEPGEHIVLPDGCADILFSQGAGESHLRVIGGMTVAQRPSLLPSEELFGVRFRPGMWGLFLRAPWPELTDRSLPLDRVAGRKAACLHEQLGNNPAVEERIRVLGDWLGAPRQDTVVQRVADQIARQAGQVRVEDLSAAAGISPRQLRRLFLEQTGRTAKQLARILRFRRSAALLQQTVQPSGAQMALECGFYDQAHFINEFRAFSGCTPGEYQLQIA